MELWQRELGGGVRTLAELQKYLPLQNIEKLKAAVGTMRFAITPHTFKRINFSDPDDPILRMAVPGAAELDCAAEELADPIGDDAHSPLPFLTHRYPDRALVQATYACAGYCRFCFRRAKTGRAKPGPAAADLEKIYAYLAKHQEIDEVILSGGDPLILTDEKLKALLKRFARIENLRRIRIHSRTLVNLPSRITASLVEIFRQTIAAGRALYLVTHFNHPNEIAKKNVEAVNRLVDSGIVVRNQSVLLRGVNDNAATQEELCRRLANIRVVPYCLHQLDLARGTNHWRVPIKRGIEIMKELQGNLTGIALPRYTLDLPGGRGKVPLAHQYVKKIDGGRYATESPFGDFADYIEPGCE